MLFPTPWQVSAFVLKAAMFFSVVSPIDIPSHCIHILLSLLDLTIQAPLQQDLPTTTSITILFIDLMVLIVIRLSLVVVEVRAVRYGTASTDTFFNRAYDAALGDIKPLTL